jgi:hypothetical protein
VFSQESTALLNGIGDYESQHAALDARGAAHARVIKPAGRFLKESQGLVSLKIFFFSPTFSDFLP